MHVEEFGKGGPALLLLHGSGAPAASLRAYARELSDRHRVLLPHRNGYDLTAVHPYEPAEELDHLLELAPEEFAVLGHSFGCYRALQLALRAPERVTQVVGLGPIAGLPEEAREAVAGLVSLIRSGADLSEAAAVRWTSPAYVAEHPEIVDRCREWLSVVDPEILAQENLEVLDRGEVLRRLAKLVVPISLLAGSEDQATPPALAEQIHATAPNTTLRVVEGMGHLPMVERFDESLAWIREALAE